MKISPYMQYSVKSPAFASNFISYKDEKGKVTNAHSSWLFRDDIDWDKFTDKLIKKYKKQNKVNIYCYACSDGSEPYTLAMMLISKLGEKKAEKFFPIIAKDIKPSIIEAAKSGFIQVTDSDLRNVKNVTGDSHTKYFEIIDKYADFDLFRIVKVNKNLREKVIFEQGDILNDAENLNKDNTVLMFRNVWPYLETEKQSELAKKLSQNLGKNSMLTIGLFDHMHSSPVPSYLSEYMEETDLENVYEKRPQTRAYYGRDLVQ